MSERRFCEDLILLAEDFRQTLSIIPKGSFDIDELNACLKASYLWRFVNRLTLSSNMRALTSEDNNAEEFSKIFLLLGNGQLKEVSGNVFFYRIFNIVTSPTDLKNKIFPDIAHTYSRRMAIYYPWLCEGAILAPRNNTVNAINMDIMREIPRHFF